MSTQRMIVLKARRDLSRVTDGLGTSIVPNSTTITRFTPLDDVGCTVGNWRQPVPVPIDLSLISAMSYYRRFGYRKIGRMHSTDTYVSIVMTRTI